LPGQSLDTYLPVILYIALFLMVSIAFRQVIARWPGHYPARQRRTADPARSGRQHSCEQSHPAYR